MSSFLNEEIRVKVIDWIAEGVKVLLPSSSLLPFHQMIVLPGAKSDNMVNSWPHQEPLWVSQELPHAQSVSLSQARNCELEGRAEGSSSLLPTLLWWQKSRVDRDGGTMMRFINHPSEVFPCWLWLFFCLCLALFLIFFFYLLYLLINSYFKFIWSSLRPWVDSYPVQVQTNFVVDSYPWVRNCITSVPKQVKQ